MNVDELKPEQLLRFLKYFINKIF